MANDSYKTISLIYNDLVRHVDYPGWARYIIRLTRHFKINTGTVLELASGTGKLFPHLKISPGNGILTDVSYSMLDQASSAYPKVCCDMTELPFKGGFDLIISCFDSVNHLSGVARLAANFKEVSRVLNSGGYFLFDIVTEENSRAYLSTYSKTRTSGKLKYSQASAYDEVTRTHLNKFLIKEGGKPATSEENREYIYTEEEIEMILSASDLEVVAKFESFSFEPVDEKTLRIQYITRKKNDLKV